MRSTSAKSAELMIAIMSFTNDEFGVVREGDRLRSDHPIVKKWPTMFVPDGLPTDEVHALRQQRFPPA